MGSTIDRTTFEHRVVEHLPAALRFATRLTGDPHVAEELTQEALVRAARSWKTFRGQSRFQTWLFRIIVNVFRDRLAHRPAASEAVHDELADRQMIDPGASAAAGELGRIIAAMVSSLPPRQREVMVLSAYEQMSAGEIANMLGITEQNVRTTLHLARQRLRTQLAPYFAESNREI